MADKPGMFGSWQSAALTLGPLLVLGAALWAGIIAVIWMVVR